MFRRRLAYLRPAMILPVVDLAGVGAASLLFRESRTYLHLLMGALLVLNMALWRLYRARLTVSALNDLPVILAATLTAAAITCLVGAALGGPPLDELRYGAVTVAFVVVGRIGAYWLIRHRRIQRHNQVPTVIVGTGPLAQLLGNAVVADRRYGCDLMGFVDEQNAVGRENPRLPAPVLCALQDLQPGRIGSHNPGRLLVAFPAMKGQDLVDIVRTLDRSGTEVYVVPRLFEMTAVTRQAEEIEGIPLQRLRRTPFRSTSWLLKRPFDVLLSGAALLLLSPLLAVIAVVNHFKDGPDILFRQTRIGLDGQEFQVLKFRSMKPANEHESATNWNIANDNRLTPWGKFLRKSSLDELPQLWNILRGDMSFVGPRPERPHFVQAFGAEYLRYDARHRVPCGLTGWAQVNGLRGDTSIEDRVRYDNYYIQNWSLWLDIKIMLRTLTSFMRGSG